MLALLLVCLSKHHEKGTLKQTQTARACQQQAPESKGLVAFLGASSGNPYRASKAGHCTVWWLKLAGDEAPSDSSVSAGALCTDAPTKRGPPRVSNSTAFLPGMGVDTTWQFVSHLLPWTFRLFGARDV